MNPHRRAPIVPTTSNETSAFPIDHHVFLSDLRTIALVDPSGAVSWLCTSKVDGPPLFGALVGGPNAGHFRIHSDGPGRQEYVAQSLIGKTSFNGITVTDFFDCSPDRAYQRAGRSDFVRLIEGTGEVFVEFAPKFDFGRVPTRLSGIENGLRIECGQQRLVLFSPGWEWQIEREGAHDVARAEFTLNEACIPLILLMGTASATPPSRSITRMLDDTRELWSGWVDTLNLPKIHRPLVIQSALALRGLCFGPTGAIAAAATTSLPETLGGARNWDYRFVGRAMLV